MRIWIGKRIARLEDEGGGKECERGRKKELEMW